MHMKWNFPPKKKNYRFWFFYQQKVEDKLRKYINPALSRLVLLGVFMISSGVGRTRTGPASTAGVLARLSVREFSGLPSLDFRLLCRELFLEPLAPVRWSGDRNILAFFTFRKRSNHYLFIVICFINIYYLPYLPTICMLGQIYLISAI